MSSHSPFHPIRAVAIDLDGTLLAPDLSISPENRATIDQLHAGGVHVILASGRHYHSMLPYARQLPAVEYLVSAQGAYASDVDNRQVLYESHLPTADAEATIRFGLDHNLSIVVYTTKGIFALSQGRWIDFYSRLAGITPPLATVEEVLEQSIFKVVYFEAEGRLDEIEQTPFLKDSHLYTVRTMTNIFEQADPKTSKRAALEALIKHLGVERQELAAFGDGNNDIPMFELAGFSAAMDRAWPDAKKAATLVTPDGDPATSFSRAISAMRLHFSEQADRPT